MKKPNQSVIRMAIIWALVVPVGTVYTLLNYFPQEVNWLTISIVSLLGFFTIYYPLMRNSTPIFTVMWVTVPTFLLYGLFVEIIVMQISILAILFLGAANSNRLYYFFFNSFWFFVMSIISAIVFYFAGGVVGSTEFWPILLAVFCYQLVHTIINRLIMRLYFFYSGFKSSIYTSNKFINYGKIVVLVPFSLTLYFIYQYIGIGAFLLLCIPYLFLTFIFRLNSMTEKVNHNLQRAGIIGHEISGNLTVNKIVDQFVLKVSGMFNTEYTYLFDHKDNDLELISSHENSGFVKPNFDPLLSGYGIADSVLLKNEPIIYSEKEQWQYEFKDYSTNKIQSILCVPISRNQKIEAVLLLASTRKSAFKEYQLKILDFLCSYFTVSIEKARYVQKVIAESNKCALTKLYNYRYLEERLTSDMGMVNNGLLDDLSVVMLDIDYFKNVNDRYGHQSGNDVLCLLAKKLKDQLPKGSMVARYGGEEFVYLLRSVGKQEALEFAEKIRLDIENTEFLVTPDLGVDKETIAVSITVSLGVASAPEDADDAQSLLRNADRSLYLWAKQAGRNRVAGYAG